MPWLRNCISYKGNAIYPLSIPFSEICFGRLATFFRFPGGIREYQFRNEHGKDHADL